MSAQGAARYGAIRELPAVVVFSVGVLAACTVAQAQSRNQLRPSGQDGVASAAVVRPIKVWTEEDLIKLRKPWDVHMDQLEEIRRQDSTLAGKTDAETAKDSVPLKSTLSDNTPIPSTVEDVQKKISVRQQEAVQIAVNLEATRQAYFDATDDDRKSKLKFDMDVMQDELRENKNDLSLLQARLESLKSTDDVLSASDATP
jgi:hypothetical protein